MDKIAQELYQNVEDGFNPTQHTTESHLTISLRYTDRQTQRFWTLSLTRLYRQATSTEREKAKEAFNIPNEAQWTPTYKNGYGIIRYTWIEQRAKQMHLTGLGGEAEFNNWQEKFD